MVRKRGAVMGMTAQRPAFAVRCLKLVLTYLTGILRFLPSGLQVIIKPVVVVHDELNNSANSLPQINAEVEILEKKKVLKQHRYSNSTSSIDIENAMSQKPSIRPQSLDFDSGLGSQSSAASTPETEQREPKTSTKRKRRRNRKSQNRSSSPDSSDTDKSHLNSNSLADLRNENSSSSLTQLLPEITIVKTSDDNKKLKTSSSSSSSKQRNILFDLPLSIPTELEESEEEADEELEKFKMYCQETNKLFDLNDSKIVIKWEENC